LESVASGPACAFGFGFGFGFAPKKLIIVLADFAGFDCLVASELLAAATGPVLAVGALPGPDPESAMVPMYA